MKVPAGRSPARWLGSSVLGVGLASFLSDAGHEAATCALPALLVALGAAPAALGIIEGVSDGLSSLAKLLGGWWADRPALRKPLAVGGYLATGFSVGLFGLATSWTHVLFARALGWFARGVRGPARDTLLADLVPREALGRAFGFERAMDTAGAVVGPLLNVLLLSTVRLPTVFAWPMVPGVLAGVAFALLVRPPPRTEGRGVTPIFRSLRALPRSFRQFLFAVFLFGLGDFARTLLILRAMDLLTPRLGQAGASATAVGLYLVHNVVYALAPYPVGLWADRTRPQRLLVAGYGLGGLTALLAAMASPSLSLLVLLFAVAGLTLAFEETLEKTITARQVPPSLRGTAYGALAATNGVGDLVSSVLVGVVWTTSGPRTAFGIAGLLCLAGALFLGAAGRKDAPPVQTQGLE